MEVDELRDWTSTQSVACGLKMKISYGRTGTDCAYRFRELNICLGCGFPFYEGIRTRPKPFPLLRGWVLRVVENLPCCGPMQ